MNLQNIVSVFTLIFVMRTSTTTQFAPGKINSFRKKELLFEYNFPKMASTTTVQVNGKLDHNGNKAFKLVDDPESLLPVLKDRLPRSCFMYNHLRAYKNFKNDFEAFKFQSESDAEKIWIVFKYIRDDWGTCFSISSPLASSEPVPKTFQDALETSGIVDWSERFMFVAVEHNISDCIVKLNVHKFGNITKIFPTYLFYMDPKDALKLEVNAPTGVEVRSLEPEGGTKFLTENWKYSQNGTDTFVRKSIEGHISSGVYVNGKLACGMLTSDYGLISCLLTSPDHRRKGYASLALNYLFKELAVNGFEPCLVVDISDKGAVAFYTSVNPRIIEKVDYVTHKAL